MGAFRVLLALSVLMAHSENAGIFQGFGGENAVEIFFVISGFYIAAILTNGYKQIKLFYINRFLRLYPIYYLILFCSFGLFLATSTYFSDFSRFSHPWLPVFISIFANIFILGSDSILFLQWHEGGLHFGNFSNSDFAIHDMLFIPQAWTLSLEITFYFLAPFLMKLRNSWLIILSLGSLFSKILFLSMVTNTDPWTYRFFPFEIHLFILGILLYRFSIKRSAVNLLSKRLVYGLVMTLYILIGAANNTWNISRYVWLTLLACVLSLIVFRSESDPADRKLGELSYPIYISHIFVIQVCYIAISRFGFLDGIMQSVAARIIFSIFLTFLLSKGLIRCTRRMEIQRDVFRNLARKSTI